MSACGQRCQCRAPLSLRVPNETRSKNARAPVSSITTAAGARGGMSRGTRRSGSDVGNITTRGACVRGRERHGPRPRRSHACRVPFRPRRDHDARRPESPGPRDRDLERRQRVAHHPRHLVGQIVSTASPERRRGDLDQLATLPLRAGARARGTGFHVYVSLYGDVNVQGIPATHRFVTVPRIH